MKIYILPVVGSLALVSVLSCTGGGNGKPGQERKLPEPGVIHPVIPCRFDSSLTYALYIPTSGLYRADSTENLPAPPDACRITNDENGTRKYPVMIIFDPHADGLLPVKKYSGLAEKYGFILIGSGNSKNGLPAEATERISRELVTEALDNFPSDTSRIYLLGFSGGARVASVAAMTQPGIRGVICCGAGIGRSRTNVSYRPDYYGIAGTGDFNMGEMLQLENPLASAGFRFFIATFTGIHAWPPAEVLEDGFVWHIMNSIRDGRLPNDTLYFRHVAAAFDERIRHLEATGQLLSAANECKKARTILQDLSPVDIFAGKLSALEKKAEYTRQAAYRAEVLKRELEEQQQLVTALKTESLSWWKTRIRRLEKAEKNANRRESWKYTEDTLKNRRLLSFLGLACYMNASALVAQHDDTGAEKAVAIYEMAEPRNPEPDYLQAVLLAGRQDPVAALGRLRIAVSKGFSDKARLAGQPEFSSLAGSAAWQELVNKMAH